MEKINIGLANLIVSAQLKEEFLNDSLLVETNKNASELLNVIKNSPMLQLEFKVLNNIERKQIDNDMLAVRYIDDNIKLFEVYTLEEINNEHAKLKSFVNESIKLDDKKVKLYNSIWTLIEESLQVNENVDVDNIHEAFDYVLNHIKTHKKSAKENVFENINEEVIEIAVHKFNEKYDKMTLAEGILFKKLINSDADKKKELFEEYRDENLTLLNALNKENINTKVSKSIQKINEMKYNPETVDIDIVSLYELKKALG